MTPVTLDGRALGRGLLDVLIRAGLIASLVVLCYRVFEPFMALMIWSLVLAVTLYPLHGMLKKRLGNRDGWAASLIVLIALGILMIPVYLLGNSLTESTQKAIELVRAGELKIPSPPDSISSWPLIGNSVHTFWLEASTNLRGLLEHTLPYLKGTSLKLLSMAGSVGMGLAMFTGALIVGGIIMAHGQTGERSALRIATRISGMERGPTIVKLCTATIRAVAVGVVGIAFIQMLLIGLGFVVYGLPGAGLLALGVLLLGIMQLPTSVITIPVIAYVLLVDGVSAGAIVFSIYTFLASMVDNVLKPMLLGRGVDVPMPVILIGALGGMVAGGIIGLFIGPVMLAIGYRLFWQWVDDQPEGSAASS